MLLHVSSPSLVGNETESLLHSGLGRGPFPKDSYHQENWQFPTGRGHLVLQRFGNDTVKSLLLFGLCPNKTPSVLKQLHPKMFVWRIRVCEDVQFGITGFS